MSDRPNNFPLLIAMVLAVGVHLLLARPIRGWMVGSSARDVLTLQIDKTQAEDEPKVDDPAHRRDKPKDKSQIGQLDPSTASVVRLVTWDDAEKLMARQSQVEQPAIQKQVDPDRAAQQTPVDPTPPQAARPNTTEPIQPAPSPPVQAVRPRPLEVQRPQPQRQVTDATKPQPEKPTESQKPQVTPGRLSPQSLDILAMDSQRPTLPALDRPSQTQTVAPGKIDKPLDKPDPQSDKTELVPKPIPPSPPAPPPEEVVQLTQSQQPAQPAQQPSPPAQRQPAAVPKRTPKPNPTVAAKSDFESEPVSEIDSAEIHPGGVFSVQGVAIKSTQPRYSVVARLTAVPRNPIFRVHFNARGIVDNVEKLQTSGYDNVDGPIVTALWKWKAEGKIAPEGVTIRRLHILLGVVKDAEGKSDSDDESSGE